MSIPFLRFSRALRWPISRLSQELPQDGRATALLTHLVAACLLLTCVMACKDLSPDLPSGTADPHVYVTAEAARQQARYARYIFQYNYLNFVEGTGILTDELISSNYGLPIGITGGTIPIDSRDMGDTADPTQTVTLELFGEIRRYTQQARHALAKYAADDPPVLQGEMYALEAMTEVYMADAFCSGVPLSTVDFEQDFTYTKALTTHEIYTHAIALFDTAITLSKDSARVHFFARIGKARALLALGRYQEADTVVVDVPAGFQYRLPNSRYAPGVSGFVGNKSSIATSEGENGLPFRTIDPTKQDPRIQFMRQLYFYPPYLFTNIYQPLAREWWTMASTVDARLIRAEAGVDRDDPSWLSLLNGLRTDSTYHVVISGGAPPDTVWHAGIGGVEGLAPFHDPALDPLPPGKTIKDVRLDLVFRERGFWLFLTGTRQGDLRRLVREYGRPQETVYPKGDYPGGTGHYGRDVNFGIERDETYNPHYLHCAGRDA